MIEFAGMKKHNLVYCETCKEGSGSIGADELAKYLIKRFKEIHKGHKVEVSRNGRI